MAPVTFRADLLAARLFAELVAARYRLVNVFPPDYTGTARLAFDAAAAFAAELKRRNPLTGEPLYPHGALPVDQDAGEPAAVEVPR